MVKRGKKMPVWNPWHGCHKISPGCADMIHYKLPDENELFSRLKHSDFRSKFHLSDKEKITL